MDIFPKRLAEARSKKPCKQRQVAEFLHITTNAYQKYEYGERRPKLDQLVEIANFLDTSVDYLLGRTDNPKSHRNRNGIPQRPISPACIKVLLEAICIQTEIEGLVMRICPEDSWPFLNQFPYDVVAYHLVQMSFSGLFTVLHIADDGCLVHGLSERGHRLLVALDDELLLRRLTLQASKNKSITVEEIAHQALS